MQELAPEDVQIEILSAALPLYNQDDEASYPAPAKALKDAVNAADAVILSTPEYNRSYSGVLKNAIDWLSRPYGSNSFAGKPVLVAGVSIGRIGTAVGQSHLKQVMVYLDAKLVGQPELYLGPGNDLFTEDGTLRDDSTRELVKQALAALAARAG